MGCCLQSRHLWVLGSVPKLGDNLSNLQKDLRKGWKMSHAET